MSDNKALKGDYKHNGNESDDAGILQNKGKI